MFLTSEPCLAANGRFAFFVESVNVTDAWEAPGDCGLDPPQTSSDSVLGPLPPRILEAGFKETQGRRERTVRFFVNPLFLF